MHSDKSLVFKSHTTSIEGWEVMKYRYFIIILHCLYE